MLRTNVFGFTSWNFTAHYALTVGFFEGGGRRPTDDEMEALLVQITSYLMEELRRDLEDGALESTVSNVDLQYTEGASMPVVLNFEIQAVHGNQSSVPTNEVYSSLTLDESQVLDLLQNYVHKAAPSGENIFANANRINFEGRSENCPNAGMYFL